MGFYDGRDEFWQLNDDFKVHVVINESEFPKANVVFVHGMGETLNRYDQAAAQLLKDGYNVIRYDQPGHGQTDGERGYLPNAQILTDVCAMVVKRVKKTYFNFSTFLLGHSMGGFTVLQTIAQLPGLADGAIATDPYSVYQHPLLGDRPMSGDPHSPASFQIKGGVNRDPHLSARNGQDPTNPIPTVGLSNALYDGSLWLRQHLADIKDPLLLLHGNDDGLISVADSWEVFQGIGSRDKEFHVYPFLMHSIMNDPARKADIFREIDQWIGRHRY